MEYSSNIRSDISVLSIGMELPSLNQYSQLLYLTKIQIEIFKEMQRKEAEEEEQDIPEPPDWN